MQSWLVLTVLMVVICCELVQCAKPCATYINTLEQIHELLVEESTNHNYNLYAYGGPTYVTRTRYILEKLNADFAKAQQGSYYNSYNPNKYYNQYGSVKPTNGCKQLEDEILAKSQEFGIQKIGLEDNLTRLRKILQYQDDRNSFYSKENEECRVREGECDEDKTELETKIQTLVANRAQLDKTIKSLNDTINKLENEKKKLQAKLNSNAPAIHGTTGIEYPIAAREINNTTSSTTTEKSLVVPNATSTVSSEAAEGADQSSVIPDIDLRNDAS